MQSHIGRTLRIATPAGTGLMSSHIDVMPLPGSDLYSAQVRLCFRYAPPRARGPRTGSITLARRFEHQAAVEGTVPGPLEETLEQAREKGERFNLPVLVQRETAKTYDAWFIREVYWHPTDWEPRIG